MVRPWAMAGPILVLLIAAPLIRPLFAPGMMSDRERVALDSVWSILRHGTLALNAKAYANNEAVIHVGDRVFSADPPAYAITLSGVAWCIERTGIRFETNPNLLNYLLIFFAITLPTAVACGLIYRMTRVFELKRPWRVGLALACVVATGWISYAVALLPHALVAALVIVAMTSIVYVAQAKRPGRVIGLLFVGGFAAALATVIEPMAAWTLPMLLGAVFLIALPWRWRVPAVLLIVAGAAGPIALHVSVNRQITGDLLPPRWHAQTLPAVATPMVAPSLGDEADGLDTSVWLTLGRGLNRFLIFTIGTHGVFSHFPILLIGVAGAGMILRRHWPRGLKWMVAASVGGLFVLLIYKSVVRIDEADEDFAAPRLILMLPPLLLWGGAWLRREHSGWVWTVAGIGLAVSVGASLIGATSPAPPGGYQHFTVAEAASRLFTSPDHVAKSR
ncbi:MAG: hypothetical protein ACTHM6_16475 [Tepidisphaeraceae bacterium]